MIIFKKKNIFGWEASDIRILIRFQSGPTFSKQQQSPF